MQHAEEIVIAVQKAGVTGAGGAGFPTFFKLKARAEVVIANGAECEPLTHVDKELLHHHTTDVINGLKAVMAATGAPKGVIGVKGKYTDLVAKLRAAMADSPELSVAELGNFYPAGDEQVLVYDVTGRVVPEGGLPLNVGCVVQNIETLYNVAAALDGTPVTSKFVTVIGAVRNPVTVRVPLGITLKQVIDLAGGATVPDPVVLNGGAMMGEVAGSLDAPVTKRTKILLVLPNEHQLSVRRRTPREVFDTHAIAACDQCYMCTDFCPRHAQGHAIQPHKLILLLASGVPMTDAQMAGALLCCECRTCNYACPVHLAPGDIALNIKRDLVKAGIKNPYHRQTEVSSTRDYRRVPMVRLVNRLGLEKFDVEAPLTPVDRSYGRVTLLLRQHAGVAAQPAVSVGQAVVVGDVVASIPEGALGAPVHASIAGTVVEIRADAIVIEGIRHVA
ncbi:MAG TPA: SLBB domain-containing protein [Anaerolineales bacterium]|nr:SLBB domain-containing protein [Anaerolineales bacterium]